MPTRNWRGFVNRLGRRLFVPWVAVFTYWFMVTTSLTNRYPLAQCIAGAAIFAAIAWGLAWWIALGICGAIDALSEEQSSK
jgi:hypothetical protein